MNVEIGVTVMEAQAVLETPVVRAVTNVVFLVRRFVTQAVAPISALLLRMGRCSLSAVPADNFITNGGGAVLV